MASNLGISAATAPAAAGSTRFARVNTATASASTTHQPARHAAPASSDTKSAHAASASAAFAGLRRPSQISTVPSSAGAASSRRPGDHAAPETNEIGRHAGAAASVADPVVRSRSRPRTFQPDTYSDRSSGDHATNDRFGPISSHDRTVRPVARSVTRTRTLGPNPSSLVKTPATSDPSAFHAAPLTADQPSVRAGGASGLKSANRSTAGPLASMDRPSGLTAPPKYSC